VPKEVLDEDDATFAEGLNCRDALLALDAAVLPANDEAPTNEKSIPEVDDLLSASVRSPRFPHTSQEGDHGLSSVEALMGPARIGSDEDVWIHRRRHALYGAADDCKVLLRHRLQHPGGDVGWLRRERHGSRWGERAR
jgi:hypothetical protein